MLPEIRLMGDVDVAALSPLLRGVIVTISYADTHNGIGLTATGAMNRKFVHWAAARQSTWEQRQSGWERRQGRHGGRA
ncbi:hypothetical protein LOF17_02965 [Sinorhizobium meliloti]|nr:hypothetical protein [Sinorhizobium meliloti]MDE4586818.1 hypothetical protein [Sinorhizobium meliloti]SEJ79017.1 hypothetical protein SAMN04244575_06238 [Sinorhizobium meliloti]